jgi:putative sterol carrier protein
MTGYHNQPEETSTTLVEGWLRTGDIGYLDGDGFLFLIDRKKEVIIRGGVNVYPKEIENCLASHPSVALAAVIPRADDKYGQVAHACVVLRREATTTEKDLLRLCQRELADYKVPAEISIRERLPTSPVGKVIKKELLRELAEETSADAVPVAHLFDSMIDRFIPEKAAGIEAVVSYRITGGGGGEWTVAIRDGTIGLSRGLADDPRVLVTARDCDYHDVTTGKIDGITAVMTGKLQLEGDMAFMAELRQLFTPIEK